MSKRVGIGDNALHIAARRGDERMVGLLLQYNCDVNKKNKKNETGLELCLNNPRLKDLVQHKLPQQPTKIVTSNVVNRRFIGESCKHVLFRNHLQ